MIKVQAFHRYGIEQKEIVDEYKFCCWETLFKWLAGFDDLNKCPKCKKLKSAKHKEDKEKIKQIVGDVV